MNPATLPTHSDDAHQKYESDSLSDSDWLEIASGDEDSVVGSEAGDSNGFSQSRRSSISLGSSRGGEVDAWEGFASDSSDDGHPVQAGPKDDSQPAAPSLEANLVEERRVRDALDQSMISTLGSSRSSYPPTVQNSVRDLRLSFPDPLTSSRNSLEQSYEAIPSSDDALAPLTDAPDTDIHSVTDSDDQSIGAPDISVSAQPLVSDVDIAIYGSSPRKWNSAEDIIHKSSISRSAWSVTQSPDGLVRWFSQEGLTYAIHDKTTEQMPSSEISPSNRPSLAIVYLPSSSVPTLGPHTLYLPILISGEQNPDDGFTSAQEQWQLLGIPDSRIFPIYDMLSGPLPEQDFLLTDADRIAFGLSQLTSQADTPSLTRKKSIKLDRFSSIHAATIFALISIIAGFVVNTSYRAPLPTPTSSNLSWTVTDTNVSNAISVRVSSSVSVVPAPESHLPAIYTRGSTLGLTTVPSSRRAARSRTSSSLSCLSETSSCLTTVKSTGDVIPHTPATVLEMPAADPSPTATLAEPTATPEFILGSSLSLRMADSLSEIVEATAKAVLFVVKNEFQVLSDALDNLLSSIRSQVDHGVKESKYTLQVFKDRLEYRNNKAKGRARHIRRKSDKLLAFASDRLKGRTTKARARAMAIKDNVLTSELWASYRQAHAEWMVKFKHREQPSRNCWAASQRRGTPLQKFVGHL